MIREPKWTRLYTLKQWEIDCEADEKMISLERKYIDDYSSIEIANKNYIYFRDKLKYWTKKRKALKEQTDGRRKAIEQSIERRAFEIYQAGLLRASDKEHLEQKRILKELLKEEVDREYPKTKIKGDKHIEEVYENDDISEIEKEANRPSAIQEA